MILELNGTKVTIVDKTLGYQGDNLVNAIQVTVDKDSIWNYKLDMYKGKSKCFDSVLMIRNGNTCTVELTKEILSYGGRYAFQLRGYTDTQTYHSEIFEAWVNNSIEYSTDCQQECGCDDKLPQEFYQVENNVTEINNHPPYPSEDGYWMIYDVDKHEYVKSDIETTSSDSSIMVVTMENGVSDKTFKEMTDFLDKGNTTLVLVNKSTTPLTYYPLVSYGIQSVGIYTRNIIDFGKTYIKGTQSIYDEIWCEEEQNGETVWDLTRELIDLSDAGKIDGVTVNGVEQEIVDKIAQVIVDKTTVGLGKVDNTSDADKPISTSTQAALNKKLAKTDVVAVTSAAIAGQAADAKSVYDLIGAVKTAVDSI